MQERYKLKGDRLEKIIDVVENEYLLRKGSKTREQIVSEELKYAAEYKSFINSNDKNSNLKEIINSKVKELYQLNKGKKSAARLFIEIKNEYVEKNKEQNEFKQVIKNRYRISEEKLVRLSNIIENEYVQAEKTKFRVEILEEEHVFSKDYKTFLNYYKQNPQNFIAEKIIENVHKIYYENKGKKSVARIFHELKNKNNFKIKFSVNSLNKNLELSVNDLKSDIEDLKLTKLRRQILKQKYNQKNGFLDLKGNKDTLINNELYSYLNFSAIKYLNDMQDLGFISYYLGFADKFQDNDISESEYLVI